MTGFMVFSFFVYILSIVVSVVTLIWLILFSGEIVVDKDYRNRKHILLIIGMFMVFLISSQPLGYVLVTNNYVDEKQRATIVVENALVDYHVIEYVDYLGVLQVANFEKLFNVQYDGQEVIYTYSHKKDYFLDFSGHGSYYKWSLTIFEEETL